MIYLINFKNLIIDFKIVDDFNQLTFNVKINLFIFNNEINEIEENIFIINFKFFSIDFKINLLI